MIFLTVGTQLPFLRLVEAVEDWAKQHPEEEVIAQLGDATKSPRMACHRVLDPGDFRDLCVKADLIVSHAGTGSFLMAHEVNTPLLVMPRRAALGEHRNDHQMATAAHFEGRPGVHVVYEADAIAPSIDRLIAGQGHGPRFADHADDSLITAIRDVVFGDGAT